MNGMKRWLSLVMCVAVLLCLTACGHGNEPSESVLAQSALEELKEQLDGRTTTTRYPDGTTVVQWTTGTEKPIAPTRTTTVATRVDPATTRKLLNTTTTKKRTTTTDDGKSTVTVPVTTTTTTKPAPVPTAPSTTTTTQAPGTPTTTVKEFDFEPSTNQRHTWLPLEERYLYSLLKEDEKAVYRLIDEAVRHLDESVTFDFDLMATGWGAKLYFLYMMDTPELFYLSKSVAISSKGDGRYGYIFSYSVGSEPGDYCGFGTGQALDEALREKIRLKKLVFDSIVDAIVSCVPTNAPEAVKERIAYDYILYSSHYNLEAQWDYRAEDNWTAYGVLINGCGVCESYAEAFQTLCNAMGINCTGIEGNAGGGHKWNAVKLEGEWYQCDITFDDPIGLPEGEMMHQFFNLTSAQMRQRNHDWSDYEYTVPTCTATKYSYPNFVLLYGD